MSNSINKTLDITSKEKSGFSSSSRNGDNLLHFYFNKVFKCQKIIKKKDSKNKFLRNRKEYCNGYACKKK